MTLLLYGIVILLLPAIVLRAAFRRSKPLGVALSLVFAGLFMVMLNFPPLVTP